MVVSGISVPEGEDAVRNGAVPEIKTKAAAAVVEKVAEENNPLAEQYVRTGPLIMDKEVAQLDTIIEELKSLKLPKDKTNSYKEEEKPEIVVPGEKQSEAEDLDDWEEELLREAQLSYNEAVLGPRVTLVVRSDLAAKAEARSPSGSHLGDIKSLFTPLSNKRQGRVSKSPSPVKKGKCGHLTVGILSLYLMTLKRKRTYYLCICCFEFTRQVYTWKKNAKFCLNKPNNYCSASPNDF